jgi:alpha-beta hydrolase superfamily lysophospholipase
MKSKSSKVIVSFTGIGHGMFAEPKEEFKKTLEKFPDYDSLFVVDKTRSWFNNVNTNEIINSINHYKTVITLGNSMGGFNAIMFASIYPVDTVIAFVPQYSILSDIVPWENRWEKHRKHLNKLQNCKYPKLIFNDTTNYYILHGTNDLDNKHIDMIPTRPNINKIMFDIDSHEFSKILKDRNQLVSTIQEILSYE